MPRVREFEPLRAHHIQATHPARFAGSFEAQEARLTLTAYFIVACARTLRVHPEVNATFRDTQYEIIGHDFVVKQQIVPACVQRVLSALRSSLESQSSGGGCDGGGIRIRLDFLQSTDLQFAGALKHRVGDRAEMRMDALQVAQNVQMQRAGLDAFWTPFP
jgi:hypothetical protein